VGEVTAKKIIAGRPYKTLDDLAKAGIPKSTIDKIRDHVTVGSPAGGRTGERTVKAREKEEPDPNVVAKKPPQKGMVWVNTDSGIFHKEGSRWYGKTREGKFMSESEAVKDGYHEARND
jgi:hypothetical protein